MKTFKVLILLILFKIMEKNHWLYCCHGLVVIYAERCRNRLQSSKWYKVHFSFTLGNKDFFIYEVGSDYYKIHF